MNSLGNKVGKLSKPKSAHPQSTKETCFALRATKHKRDAQSGLSNLMHLAVQDLAYSAFVPLLPTLYSSSGLHENPLSVSFISFFSQNQKELKSINLDQEARESGSLEIQTISQKLKLVKVPTVVHAVNLSVRFPLLLFVYNSTRRIG